MTLIRTIQPHLNQMWELLWHTAASDTPGTAPTAAHGGHSGEGADLPSASSGTAVAASAGGRLVLAYRELRQLEFLVRSLIGAMRVAVIAAAGPQRPPSSAAVGPTSSSSSPSHLMADACARLVRHPQILGALRQAVENLPPGDKPLQQFIIYGYDTAECY